APGVIRLHSRAGANGACVWWGSVVLLGRPMGLILLRGFAGAKPVKTKSVSPGLLRKLFWRVTFAWRGKSHQNRADRTRLFRRNYTGTGLTETLNTPSLMLDPI